MGLLTDMDEMKGAAKDLWDAYYAKNPGGWSGLDSFSAIDSGQMTPDVAEAKLLGYYNDLPVYGGGYLGVGSFNGNDPYFGTYYNIDDKGNVTTKESKQYTGSGAFDGFLSIATGGWSDVINGNAPLSSVSADAAKWVGPFANPGAVSAHGVDKGAKTGDWASALQYAVDPITEPGIDILARESGEEIGEVSPELRAAAPAIGSLVGSYFGGPAGLLGGYELGNKIAGGSSEQGVIGGAAIGASLGAGSLVGNATGSSLAGKAAGKAASTGVKYIGNELTQDGYPATGVTPTEYGETLTPGTQTTSTGSSPYRNYILSGLLSSMGKQQTPVFYDYASAPVTATAPMAGNESASSMDEMKGAAKDLWDAYYAKNPGGWSGFDGFSAIDSGQTTPDVAEAKLLGYYNDLPVFGGGYLGLGSFNGNDPYFGTYYNIDDKGNVTTQESKRFTRSGAFDDFLSIAAGGAAGLLGGLVGNATGSSLAGKAASIGVKYIGNKLTQDGYPATGATPTEYGETLTPGTQTSSSATARNYILAGLLSSMAKQQTPVFSDYTPIAPTVTAPTIATESAANFKPVTSDRTRVLHDYSGDQEKQRTIAEILSNPYKGYLSDYLNYLA
jgi:hypothetical protein